MPYFSNVQIIINEIIYNQPVIGIGYIKDVEISNASNSPINLLNSSNKDAVALNFPDRLLAFIKL